MHADVPATLRSGHLPPPRVHIRRLPYLDKNGEARLPRHLDAVGSRPSLLACMILQDGRRTGRGAAARRVADLIVAAAQRGDTATQGDSSGDARMRHDMPRASVAAQLVLLGQLDAQAAAEQIAAAYSSAEAASDRPHYSPAVDVSLAGRWVVKAAQQLVCSGQAELAQQLAAPLLRCEPAQWAQVQVAVVALALGQRRVVAAAAALEALLSGLVESEVPALQTMWVMAWRMYGALEEAVHACARHKASDARSAYLHLQGARKLFAELPDIMLADSPPVVERTRFSLSQYNTNEGWCVNNAFALGAALAALAAGKRTDSRAVQQGLATVDGVARLLWECVCSKEGAVLGAVLPQQRLAILARLAHGVRKDSTRHLAMRTCVQLAVNAGEFGVIEDMLRPEALPSAPLAQLAKAPASSAVLYALEQLGFDGVGIAMDPKAYTRACWAMDNPGVSSCSASDPQPWMPPSTAAAICALAGATGSAAEWCAAAAFQARSNVAAACESLSKADSLSGRLAVEVIGAELCMRGDEQGLRQLLACSSVLPLLAGQPVQACGGPSSAAAGSTKPDRPLPSVSEALAGAWAAPATTPGSLPVARAVARWMSVASDHGHQKLAQQLRTAVCSYRGYWWHVEAYAWDPEAEA